MKVFFLSIYKNNQKFPVEDIKCMNEITIFKKLGMSKRLLIYFHDTLVLPT